MKGQHQNPAEAVEGMKLCGAPMSAATIGVRYSSPMRRWMRRLWPQAALTEHGVEESRFRPMHPGEVFDVPSA